MLQRVLFSVFTQHDNITRVSDYYVYESTVPLKCKLPLLVSFLARRVSFLSRRVSFLSRRVSFLSRITEAFSLEYKNYYTCITRKTLKTVSFHTGSRGVLFGGIRFQQTRNMIECLQFDHVQ